MNYRHGFHAGNFADVFKHAVWARILTYLQRKDAPFRVIDTHAGEGLYALDAEEALRSGEAAEGVGRLAEPLDDPEAEALLAPWRRAVAAVQAGRPRLYPGSPTLAMALTRPQDRLTFAELRPEAVLGLRRHVARDRRVTVVERDGWQALDAALPPPERRGAVLIDPPFEQPGEFGRILSALALGARKWGSGTVVAWYPVKHPAEVARFMAEVAGLPLPETLRAEILVDTPKDPPDLHGCGLVIVHPPWTLGNELARLLPSLAARLARGDRAGFRVDMIHDEPSRPTS